MILALALGGSAPPAWSVDFRLLVPFDGAVLHSPAVLSVYQVSPGTGVLVQIDGIATESPSVPVPGNDEDLNHLRIAVPEGRHRLRWIDRATEEELGAATVTYIPPQSLRTAHRPGDRNYAFHTMAQEGNCKPCHNLPEEIETLSGRPLAPAGKVCAACHPVVEGARHLHGPVAVYDCFRCHNPDYRPARFTWRKPQASTCDSCHEGYLARVLGSHRHVHGPVAAGACMACHSPHGGETPMLLREQVPGLCLLCHADTLEQPVSRGLHGRESCTRCHDPHAGSTRFLTRAEEPALCGGCHEGVAVMQADGHPFPRHPVEARVDPSHPGQAMTCSSCHDLHGSGDVSKQGVMESRERRDTFCGRCHY